MKYTVSAACICTKGKVRENNEDNFLFDKDHLGVVNDGLESTQVLKCESGNLPVFAVFDGVGGSSNGEIAAHIAAQTLKSCVENNADNDSILRSAVIKMNDEILRRTNEESLEFMATTCAMIRFSDEKVSICNVGDSRIYRYSRKKLSMLSIDHAVQSELSQAKPVLVQYLGFSPDQGELSPFTMIKDPQIGDKYLICTDGVTDMVTDKMLEELLAESNPQKAVDKICSAALNAGGRDNITAIVCVIKKA